VDGKLTGMMGFPLHPLTLRSVRGSGYPPSDVEMMRPSATNSPRPHPDDPAAGHLHPIRWVDINRMPDRQCGEAPPGEYGASSASRGTERGHCEVARANFPRENFTFDEIVNRDSRN